MGRQDSRTVLDKTCMAVGGFCQPQPFMYLYHMLGMLDDGFTDRISMCIVKYVILKENEIEEWNVKFNSFNIAQFDEIYAVIYNAHQLPKTYTFDEEARALYVQFSNSIVQDMNRRLEDDVILSDNLSKDRKFFENSQKREEQCRSHIQYTVPIYIHASFCCIEFILYYVELTDSPMKLLVNKTFMICIMNNE